MQHESFAAAADNVSQLYLQCRRIGQAELGNGLQPGQLRGFSNGPDPFIGFGEATRNILQFEYHVGYASPFAIVG